MPRPSRSTSRHSGRLLEFSDRVADGRLRPPELQRGVGEAASLREGKEGSKVCDIKHGTCHEMNHTHVISEYNEFDCCGSVGYTLAS